MVMLAPMRLSSPTCMKRFSKMFSVTTEVPSACVMRAMYWACMSVGKPGYSSVDMSLAVSEPPEWTRTLSLPTSSLTPQSSRLGDDGAEVRGVAAVDVEVAAGDGAGDEEGAGLDAVRIDAVLCAVEFGDALDLDGAGAGAFDLCAHGVEQSGEVGDLGLAGAVFEEGFAVGEGGGHEEVFGAGDGDLVEDDVRAFEAVGAGFEVAVLLGDGGAHGFEALDVEVDGAAADGAAAGHGDAGHAGARDERAEHERAGAHGLDDLVLGDGVGEDAALDAGAVLGAAVAELDLGAHGGEELALGLDVADLRDVFEDDLVFGEDGGGHARERGVLCAGDLDGAEERVAAADDKLVHLASVRMAHVDESGWKGAGRYGRRF